MAKRRPNSRRIGKEAELEGAHKFNRLFKTEFRRSSQNRGAPDAPDIIDDRRPELVIECKRRQKFNVYDAVAKAKAETDGAEAIVIHRRPRGRWMATVDLHDLPKVVAILAGYLGEFPHNVELHPGDEEIVGTFLDDLHSRAEFNREVAESEGINGRRKAVAK